MPQCTGQFVDRGCLAQKYRLQDLCRHLFHSIYRRSIKLSKITFFPFHCNYSTNHTQKRANLAKFRWHLKFAHIANSTQVVNGSFFSLMPWSIQNSKGRPKRSSCSLLLSCHTKWGHRQVFKSLGPFHLAWDSSMCLMSTNERCKDVKLYTQRKRVKALFIIKLKLYFSLGLVGKTGIKQRKCNKE